MQVGIDFGTTCSAVVAYMKNVPIKSGDGGSNRTGKPTRSVVAVHKETGSIITGQEAWKQKKALDSKYYVFSSVKTELMNDSFTRVINGQNWDAVRIAGELFKRLKTDAVQRGISFDSVTMAIPVGFNADKRAKLRQAAATAGIEIATFISEPTAAFYANYQELKATSIVAVFDWGGGTLDVSIIKHERNRVYELATVGMSKAGDYIDDEIARRLHLQIARNKNKNIAFDDMSVEAQDRMRIEAENAKIALSDDDLTSVILNKYGEFGNCNAKLNYDRFSEIVNPVIEQAMACLEKAINESKVGIRNVDKILMVGGSSKLRPLIEKMEVKYGIDKLLIPEETMWNVAEGAAMLAKNPGEYRANQEVGLVLSDGSKFVLLPQDTLLRDWHKTYTFGLVDTDEEARFVFTGSPDIDESEEKYKSIEVPAYRFMQEKLFVEAKVDRDMILQVKAGTRMRPKEYARVWEYPYLKCYYEIHE